MAMMILGMMTMIFLLYCTTDWGDAQHIGNPVSYVIPRRVFEWQPRFNHSLWGRDVKRRLNRFVIRSMLSHVDCTLYY